MRSVTNRKIHRAVADCVAGIPWLQELASPDRDRALADMYESVHLKGDTVVRAGDITHSWILVTDGLLKVVASDHTGQAIMYAGVSSGAWIGEGSLIKK